MDAGRNLEDEISLALLLGVSSRLCCCAIGVARSGYFGSEACELIGGTACFGTTAGGGGELSCVFFLRAAD
jgi:hypothetical protein